MHSKSKRQYAEVKKFIEKHNCELVSKEYLNTDSKLLVICSCGEHFEVSFYCFLHKNKRMCNKCSKSIQSKKYANKYEDVFNYILENNCILLTKKYINAHQKLEIVCSCGNKFNSSFTGFKKRKNKKCKKCCLKIVGEQRRITQEDFEKRISNIKDSCEYVFLDEYTRILDYVSVLHKSCGTIYKVKPHNFLNGCRCPRCKSSNGEKQISDYLKRKKIEYIPQKTFEGCRIKKMLPFDFYLPEYNLCIEYNGEQHYKQHENYFGGKEGFEIRKRNDSIKRNYCKKNKIQLLEIPYWEIKNINKIINKRLENEKRGGECNKR